MKYTLLMTLLAPALLAGCNLEKKEEPFQARHIRAGYDAGQVCQQLRQGWQEDGIAIPASQVSCHYLTVPLDYDKEWVQIKETKWEKRSAARADSSLFADNSPRFPSWSDKPVRPHVKQETRTVKGNTLDVFYLHYRANGDYRGTLFYNPGGPTSATPDLGLLLDMLRSANPAILEHYDIVTLDPRGAGYSALGHELRSCLLTDKQGVRPDMSPAQLTQLFASRDKGALPALQSGADQGKAFSTALLARCDEPLRLHAPHLGSRAVVEDMERLRQHLGRERITPITFSYGTRLAALYAAHYPSHVANLVVDSPMSPAENRYPAIFRGDAENANRILAWRFGDQALQRSMAVTRQVRDNGRYVDNQGNVLDRAGWRCWAMPSAAASATISSLSGSRTMPAPCWPASPGRTMTTPIRNCRRCPSSAPSTAPTTASPTTGKRWTRKMPPSRGPAPCCWPRASTPAPTGLIRASPSPATAPAR